MRHIAALSEVVSSPNCSTIAFQKISGHEKGGCAEISLDFRCDTAWNPPGNMVNIFLTEIIRRLAIAALSLA
jgi:hypothetical protein